MIILNDNRNVNIPDYNDLINKPSINGVTLEGDVSAAELGIVVDTTNFYTKNQSDNRFQPKGNYLTEIPSNYATKSYVDDAVKDIKIDASVDLTGYATESWVRSNYQPKGNYLTSIPSNYVTDSELQGKDYATNDKVDEEIGKLENSISDKQDTLVSGLNVKTINGKSILGSGNIVIEGGSGGSTDLTGYATEDWVGANYQPKGNYLTEIPSEYVTETELNDAIAGLGGGSDVPYVVIENKYATTLTTISGDLQATLNAAKNKQPFLAYFYSTYAAYGKVKTLYPFTNVIVDESGFSLGYHTEISAVHKDIFVNGSYDTTTGEYSLSTISILTHSYATTTQLDSKQDTLVSGTNIKTINGQSLLGSGNITIESETDLTGYATTSYVDNQIGNINTILENILN